jgi:hypothetical protein
MDGRPIVTIYQRKKELHKFTCIPQDPYKNNQYGKMAQDGHEIVWITKNQVKPKRTDPKLFIKIINGVREIIK